MCDPILVTLLKMRAHYSQSSRENATPSSGTSPLASYKEVPPSPLGCGPAPPFDFHGKYTTKKKNPVENKLTQWRFLREPSEE